MRLTHLQSASVIVEAGGQRILTDPWLVQGEYYGSWYHYPPLPMAPEDLEYDWIYVSHIHPDHMSRKTLERLDRTKPVLIHKFDEKFLKRNIESLGFEVIELPHGAPFDLGGGASIEIFAADDCDPELCGKFFGCAPVERDFRFTQIDSLAVISDGMHALLNTNDCPYELATRVLDKVKARHPRIDCLLVGYAGAGPFPQCFTFSDDALKSRAAERKHDQFIAQAVKYIRHVEPSSYMPFAGTYVLGGRLGPLNAHRGVPALDTALAEIEERLGKSGAPTGRGFLLNAGKGFDVDRGEAEAPYRPASAEDVAAFVESTRAAPYDFDEDAVEDDATLFDLAAAAWPRFARKADQIGFASGTRIVVGDGNGFAVDFTATRPPRTVPADAAPDDGPVVQIACDRRLLGRLLRGPRFAHWNNAEIGSHLAFRRDPDVFERGLYYCLSAFHA
ncbi:MBL fold metallo-hydrolase [Mesobaculum littorinae]|nr:MBL fold metallo-hydrolase [Mesobaculum littorinae]